MADIEWLQKRVADLSAQLRDAEAELTEARLAACPVKIGDIVTSTRTGVRYLVTKIDVLRRGDKPERQFDDRSAERAENESEEWQGVDDRPPSA